MLTFNEFSTIWLQYTRTQALPTPLIFSSALLLKKLAFRMTSCFGILNTGVGCHFLLHLSLEICSNPVHYIWEPGKASFWPGHFRGQQILCGDSSTPGQELPGCNSSVGCVDACSVTSVMSNSLQPHELQPSMLLCPWDSPDRNTGVGCHALLQGIFLTQRSNPYLWCLL